MDPRLTAQGAEALVPLVYDQLRSLAARYVSGSGSATLQPTALVHEAWIRLERQGGFEGREHFAAVAAKAMRQILVDRARARGRDKRGNDPVREAIYLYGGNGDGCYSLGGLSPYEKNCGDTLVYR